MFARTERLTLRPGWIEDAPELARAMGHWDVVSKLARVPWPYDQAHAEQFLTSPRPRGGVMALICERHRGGAPIIGGIGIGEDADGNFELGYWLTPSAWGRGYATEAGRAMIAAARDSLRLRRLVSGHFIDNPASGRVLRKLGFKPTGRMIPRHSLARGHETPSAAFELELCSGEADNDPGARMAA
ncbi:GNAT family N-acetyltransferase [Sphingomonas canadensis]|uniref:GNAT family N-acetyltransferase n=1 Tax=Sphingomonas canadensis TaxID=1219257 RepID=A0ABW3H399_9SPHN|nr:GNAT family N-acetyltransferase [Sphingomonas canadensis]MCW3835869.1 GNAT family N-acetyltransferase [Sphingomonas canadensis]